MKNDNLHYMYKGRPVVYTCANCDQVTGDPKNSNIGILCEACLMEIKDSSESK